MDLEMGYLGMDVMTYNYFLRAGARTIQDVCSILEGKKAKQRDIPESVMRRAKEYVKTQERVLHIRLLEVE